MDASKTFISYLRVSTKKQGESQLGIEAQRETLKRFVGPNALLLYEYVEIESGRRHENRPQLATALAACTRTKATLVVAKLDRLSRDPDFLGHLMKAGVDFKCCDMPEADKFTVRIFAAMAERERELISSRTRAALAAKRARGERLGPVDGGAKARERARMVTRTLMPAPAVIAQMQEMRERGAHYHVIADRLNGLGVLSCREARWYGGTVKHVLDRASAA
jgi:DNA invertase Pin-like site-specific DNA recombinase